MEFLDKLSLAGLVPVIAIEDANDAVPLCKALSDGGLPVAEITFRTAAAEETQTQPHTARREAGKENTYLFHILLQIYDMYSMIFFRLAFTDSNFHDCFYFAVYFVYALQKLIN